MLNSFIYTTSQVFLAKGSPVKCRTFVFCQNASHCQPTVAWFLLFKKSYVIIPIFSGRNCLDN